MADLSEVLDAIRDAASAVLYPGGVPSGRAPASAAGAPVRVYVGWPGADLDKDLAAGICHVTVWPRGGVSRSLGPYMDGWQPDPPVTPSLAAVAGEQQVTFAGTAAVPLMVAAVIVDNAASYTHAVAANDTPETVAAALAALIAPTRSATAVGAVLHIPDASPLVARVVAGGKERREIRRLAQGVLLTAWCHSPVVRDQMIQLLDEAFLEERRTLVLPDTSKATITYDGSAFDEEARAQPLHRRDLMLTAEYVTLQERSSPPVAVPTAPVAIGSSVIRRVVIA